MELLVVFAVITTCAVFLLPARAASRAQNASLQCLLNQKQLMAAMLMYAQENGDHYPPNPDDGNAVIGHNWCRSTGELYGYDAPGLTNIMIMPYLGQAVDLFRCPLDPRPAYRLSGTPPRRIPISRSVSMNQAVGTICPTFDAGGGHSGKPILSVNGPWLNNSHSNRRNSPYRTYGKTTEAVAPTPSNLWVLLEEDPDSINDGGFSFGMANQEWIDYPATAHNFGCAFGFADGHAEVHQWADSRTKAPYPITRRTAQGSVDWAWMAARTSSRAP